MSEANDADCLVMREEKDITHLCSVISTGTPITDQSVKAWKDMGISKDW